jgi:very-short-patch-repair endonuclease
MPTETGERAAALFEYLTKLIELRSRPVRDISEYDEHIWFADLPGEPEVSSAVGATEGVEEWLAVRRPRLQEGPPLPPELRPWIDESTISDPTSDPRLVEEIVDADGSPSTPDRQARVAWSRYIPKWSAWASERRRIAPVFDLYQRLFDIQQRGALLGEQYETVIGLGLLFARSSTGTVRRHLVTARARVEYEVESGRIALVPDPDGTDAAVETDMLDAAMTASADVSTTIRSGLAELGTALLDVGGVEPLLTTWINSVSTSGLVEPDLAPPSSRPANEPYIAFAPAVILRKRTQRSLIAFYRALIADFRNGTEPPPLVRGLVEILEAEDQRPSEDPGQDQKTYFPLPANDEQLRIVERLRANRGVVVVGPPGTGKSHTIANLVSDALAHGRRVVVTSHTARALEVLVEKLPEDIRDLCVIMAGEGRGLSTELRRSVDALLNRSSSPEWTVERVADRISTTSAQLAKIEKQRADVLTDRRRLRESASDVHSAPFGEYKGTPARIAEQLAAEKSTLGWLPDEVTDDPPMSGDLAREWLALERRLGPDSIARGSQPTPDAERLLDPAEFKSLVEEKVDADEAFERGVALKAHPAWEVLRAASGDGRSDLRVALTQLRRHRDRLTDTRESWIAEAIHDVLAGREQPWVARERSLNESIALLADAADTADEVEVSGLEGFDLRLARRQVHDLVAHVSAGKSFGIGPFRPKVVKDADSLLATVKVDGAQPRSAWLLQHLNAVLSCRVALDDLRRSWGDRIAIDDPSMKVASGHLLEANERIGPILALQRPLEQAKASASAIDDLVVSDWTDRESLRYLEDAAGAVDAARRRDEASDRQRRLIDVCQPFEMVPEVARLQGAIERLDSNAYERAHDELRGLWDLKADLAQRDELFGRMAYPAPSLAGAVRDQPSAGEWDAWFAKFDASWCHARVVDWMHKRTSDGAANDLDAQLARLDVRHRQHVAQLGALHAWDFALRRLTQGHRAHLQAYRMAIAKYGKGQGKFAARYLRQARDEMQECIDAVPAWIMPTYRLAESMTSALEPFDLAIVDEASQSGIDGLFIWALAKQVIVVGDDQQISPDAVGINLEEVHRLQAQLIPNIPFKDRFEPSTSIFDQALIRYPGQLQLREHFRCMPEIIGFSNHLCYSSSPLQPVRQFGSDRLQPLMAIHIEGAEEQDGVNRLEATAVVDKIVECCADPRYADASMGVISLTGDRQAKFIQRRLIERIGPDLMLKHRIKCGDAYAFQGDQRRVMFLSMVAAPTANGHRLMAQVNTQIQQRFNVAASRAEDQAWLFHSVTQNDLSPDCLRHKLLSHFRSAPGLSGTRDVPEVSAVERDDLFDSLFEQRVYRRIGARGYHVTPQFEVLGFRIDLVVTGGAARLAVECDGDEWHGPEQYERDTARQRDLERCGWTFVRIVESDFYLDPEEAMAPVWAALDRLGIGPRELELVENPPPAIESDSEEYASLPVGQAVDEPGPAPVATPTNEPLPARAVATTEPIRAQPEDLGLDLGAPPSTSRSIRLGPYRAFSGRSFPLLTVPSAAVEAAILQVVATEGPMTVGRLRRVYMRGIGRDDLTVDQRSALNRTVTKLVNERRVAVEVAMGAASMANWSIRLPATPPVVARERGPRAFGDVPLSELAHVADLLRSSNGPKDAIDALLLVYAVPTPSAQQRDYLRRAVDPSWALAQRPADEMRSGEEPVTALSAREAARTTRDFQGILDSVVNDALALGSRRLAKLGESWLDDEEVEAVRQALGDNLRTLGVADDINAISARVRDRMPNESGRTRGAVADAVLAKFLGQIADQSAVNLMLRPWQAAMSEFPEGARPVGQGQCVHGASWGTCRIVRCPGHFLGSAPSDYDWRTDG